MLIPEDKQPQPLHVEPSNERPPAYTPTDSTNASTTQDAHLAPGPSSCMPPRPLPTNFLNISRTNHAIKGIYLLDLSIPPLPSVVPPQDANGRPLNLRVHSTNGSIDVAAILRARDAKGPALLDAATTNGSIKVQVEDEDQGHFRLRAASTNGAITLNLPPTFNGPISTKQMNGRLVFSPALQARLTTFSEDGHESSFFVGDYRSSGFVDDASWLGDAVRVEAHNGRVKLGCTGEPEEERIGFFKRFFGV